MDKHNTHGPHKLIIGLVSLLSMLFIASASFEKKPQDCRMINISTKRKKI